MISAPDRALAIELINEAVKNGARRCKACSLIGITERTYFRWCSQRANLGILDDLRPSSDHSNPPQQLSEEECKRIIEIVNSPKYKDLPVAQIIVKLLDEEKIYIASESTFRRVMKKYGMSKRRGRVAAPGKRRPEPYSATAPNQVWVWDITLMNGPNKGQYFYLYMFLDIFDRFIVGWEIHEEQTAERAAELIAETCIRNNRLTTQPLVLHSDNGSPMKGETMLEMLYKLGIKASRSRPRVSDDNAYAESVFKTLKYRPDYLPKGFKDIQEARKWVKTFVNWYNYQHYHSGIKFLTPAQRRSGESKSILEVRKEIYEAAKQAHPERWKGRNTRDWNISDIVYLHPWEVVDKRAKTGKKTSRPSSTLNAKASRNIG